MPDQDFALLLQKEQAAHRRTREQLANAHERAKAAKRAQSLYMAGITHELRTPLHSLLGYVQLLQDDKDLPKHRLHAVRIMRRSAEHMADLIQNMLDISSIEAGALELSYQQFDLTECLSDIAGMFERIARRKQLGFVLNIPDNMPGIVRSDHKRLRQILTNLLSNAVRYTQKGHIEFSVNYRSHVAEFIISDTGIGIDSHDVERIFLPFERLSQEGAGTGLGLTITRLFIDILGGDLRLESTPGEGSRFTVRLFMAPVRHPELSTDRNRGHIIGYEGPRQKVLVVDDNADQRQFLSDILSPRGFEVHLAATGQEGLAQAQDQDPDLVILDMLLPDIHGLEVARGLRGPIGRGPAIMIVSAQAETVQPQPNTPERPLWDAILSKPVSIDVLLDNIGAVLKLAWKREEGAGQAPISMQDFAQARACISDTDIARLRESASLGHIKGLMETLAEIENDQPEAAPATAALKEAVEDLDMDRIDALLRSVSDPS